MGVEKNFKPEIIVKALILVAGRSPRLSGALVLEEPTGVRLVEAKRYWGPCSPTQAEIDITKMALSWARDLRFEKLELQLGFPSLLSSIKDHQPIKKIPRDRQELISLLQSFRLFRVSAPAPDSELTYVRELAESVHPAFNRKAKS
jgi:hypothetical protein